MHRKAGFIMRRAAASIQAIISPLAGFTLIAGAGCGRRAGKIAQVNSNRNGLVYAAWSGVLRRPVP